MASSRAITSGRVPLETACDFRGVDRPRENRSPGVIEVQQVLNIGTLRQDDHAGIRMPGEEGNHRPRIAAERLQGQPVLKFAEIEGGRTPELGCGSVHFRKDFLQVEEYLHGRREPDARRAGQVAVMAAVGAEAVGREMPVVRAGVASLLAETHRTAVLAENERLLAAARATAMGRFRPDRLDYAGCQTPRRLPLPGKPHKSSRPIAAGPACDCSPSPARSWRAETAAQAAADSLPGAHRPRTSG